MTDAGKITVEPISGHDNGRWRPRVGPEVLSFLDASVPAEAHAQIRDAAIDILAKGAPPTAEIGQETGLVVGYVQSGKTMSFEAVAALADNGFQIVIVVAGTSNPLFNQSTGRLRRDLRLDDSQRERRWVHFKNPGDDDATVQPIRDVLDERRDAETPAEYKRTVLITVLKNYQRLRSLRNLTATPQAPLLISIIDSLSPNFVLVLEPGAEYVGGREFFSDNQPLIKLIPPQEVPTNANPLTEPPESLLAALRVFEYIKTL